MTGVRWTENVGEGRGGVIAVEEEDEGEEEKEEKGEEGGEEGKVEDEKKEAHSESRNVVDQLPRGVQYDLETKEYTAGMTISGKYRILGRFQDVKSAQTCYEEVYNRYRKK